MAKTIVFTLKFSDNITCVLLTTLPCVYEHKSYAWTYFETLLAIRYLSWVIKPYFCFMITQSTWWKKALKCNVTLVNDPVFTSEYLRLQLLFVSLLCKSPTANPAPDLKTFACITCSDTAGTEGPRKNGRAFAPFAPQSSSRVPALQLGARQVKTCQ